MTKPGFWEYCQANLKEVMSWPDWMRGGSGPYHDNEEKPCTCGAIYVTDGFCPLHGNSYNRDPKSERP